MTPQGGVAFLPVDRNLPLEAQLPFDVFLHKVPLHRACSVYCALLRNTAAYMHTTCGVPQCLVTG